MKSLVLVLVFLAWFAAPASANLYEGWAASQRGDYATAFREWKPLAEAGNAAAQFGLGLLYDEGSGVLQDYKEAARWYRLAAEQGHVIAHFNLGLLYANGTGVPQDYKEAARWYRPAAEHGYAGAQYNLGRLYGTGEGVPQDIVQAHMWFNLAAAQGNKNALVARDLLARFMSQSQIAEAQRLAREWKPKK